MLSWSSAHRNIIELSDCGVVVEMYLLSDGVSEVRRYERGAAL
jgi:hypothetical protein